MTCNKKISKVCEYRNAHGVSCGERTNTSTHGSFTELEILGLLTVDFPAAAALILVSMTSAYTEIVLILAI